MNGPQDLGGAHGFGPLPLEENEPLFHDDWERRVLALTLAMGASGSWNIDASRHARERTPPAEYLSSSYYRIWFEGLVRLIEETGLASTDEIASGRMTEPPKRVKRVLKEADVAAVLAKGGPADRSTETKAQFAVGDRVRARVMNPKGHTRLPRYVRGHTGTIERIHGCHVFPDSAAHGLGDDPQWLYGVVFDAGEVWGEARGGDTLHIDLWEPYLERL
ncbi:MAG: nitrile hydratase subunit beta [Tepidamorphaceae bacterium]|nr:nitrile hydratase subunit beta [Rhodobiaceae bacterium]MCC0050110.1 nitrile hydratase subunit beta [Rhodobiaceae bacterium]